MALSGVQHLVRHSLIEDAPRPGTVYRCPVCKLELVADPNAGKINVATIDPNEPPTRRARQRP